MDKGQTDFISAINQKYCIDSSSIKDFWDTTPTRSRPYHVKVQSFRRLWEYIALQVANRVIIVPEVVGKGEVTAYDTELAGWLKRSKKLFVSHDNCLNELAEIVKEFPIYTKKDRASLNDALIVAIAKKRGLTVITSETYADTPSRIKPKIPNVCEAFLVDCVNLPEYFKREGL